MFSGDKYYVLVNKNDEEFELEDVITGYTETAKYDSAEDAEEALKFYIEEEILNEEDGWHVERSVW